MKKSELLEILTRDVIDSEGMEPSARARFLLASMIARGMYPPGSFIAQSAVTWNEEIVPCWEDEDE